jgi:hypothetical protein
MKKAILLGIICSIIVAFQTEKLKKVQLTKTISVALPESFRLMNDDEIARKYYTYRKPVASFTNPELTADFSFNESATPWRKEDIQLLKNMYQASITKLYTKVEFIQQDVKVINERNFAVFEFVSEIREENKESMNYGKVTRGYEYIQYTVENNKVLIFHFSCPLQIKDKWQSVAAAVMKTVKIKNG